MKRKRLSSPARTPSNSQPQQAISPNTTIQRWIDNTLPSLVIRKKISRGDSDASSRAASYADQRYPKKLEAKGSFLHDSEDGLCEESRLSIYQLRRWHQEPPKDSLFDDVRFAATCTAARNELRIFRDMTPLLVPSAELLALYDSNIAKCFIESIGEKWTNCIPLTNTTPQPTFAVGFSKSAFNPLELQKLKLLAGDYLDGDQSFFMATSEMFFPFLTCEIKGDSEVFDVADRRNAHSMTVAIRAVALLHQLCNQQGQIHGKMLGFSVSHNNEHICAYAHYPSVRGAHMTYHRHTIHSLDLLGSSSDQRWASYKLIKNIYQHWVPSHLQDIRKMLNQVKPSSIAESGILEEAAGLRPDLET